MKLTFLSNYYNHHQRPVCEAWDKLTDKSFAFVSTERFSDERRNMGWRPERATFLVDGSARDESLDALVDAADYVVLGSAQLSMVKRRLEKKKIVFKYSERVFKGGYNNAKWLPRLFSYYCTYGRHRSLYLLAASAFAYWDFAMHGAFRGKCYKWGYFPETRHYDIDGLLSKKDSSRVLWCGRLIDWKHPEEAIKVAESLRAEGLGFKLDMIGAGPLKDELQRAIEDKGLQGHVELLGAMSPEQVRAHMEAAGVYIFTSDFNEGWGAVLNEAMNSGCAVVASHAIGSVPFLVKHGCNGLVYMNGDTNDLCRKVKTLIMNPQRQKDLGRNSYGAIVNVWNAELAAERFMLFAEEIERSGSCNLFEEGPCSKAAVVKNNWFKEDDYDVSWLVE